MHLFDFDINHKISDLATYITKLLDSDWVLVVQIFVNTVQKRVNSVQFTHRIVAFDWLINNSIGFGKNESNHLINWFHDVQSSKSKVQT